jgi:putative membrane protein
MQLTVIISMIFAIFIAVFAGLNSTVVDVNLLVVKLEMSLAIVILMSAVFGAAIMYLLNMVKAFKRSRELKTEIKEKKALRKEVEKLTATLEEKEKSNDEIDESLI